MKSLFYLNKYFIRYRIRLLLGILFVVLSNYFAVDSIKYVRKAVDYVLKSREENTFMTADITIGIVYFGALVIGTALMMGLFMFFMRQTIIVMSRLIEYDLKNEIYAHYQKLDMSFYKQQNTGDLMNRISEDVSRVRMYIGPAIMYIVNTAGTFTLTIIVMLNVSPKLTLYSLLPLPVLAFSIYWVSNVINKKSTSLQQQQSYLSTISQESFSGIRVLKSYSREDFNSDLFADESNRYRLKSLSLVKTEALFHPFMLILIGLSTILTIYIGGIEAINGNITMGNMAEFVLYINRLTWPIASLGWVTSLIQRAAASQQRINEFLNTLPNISTTENAIVKDLKGEIELKNLSFVYPDSGTVALKDISFKINKGESFAIIGRTGSGKSTLANLLLRMYDKTSGELLIDGRPIENYNLSSLRTQIGYVPQDVFLFSDTIKNNIAFGLKSPSISTDKIEQAAKDAAIYDSILGFPNGFETFVGERGITLSGGQKQRISIARAIIKNPPILIFDDCLSAVDAETEEQILSNFNRVMKGKTSIIISHRVSSVKYADNIILLDKGKIVEQGNHDILINKKGLYYDLYNQQVKR